MQELIMTQNESSLERIAGANPELEIWWDSSPLIFSSWAEQWLAGQTPDRAAQLARFFEGPVQQRVICGVTTNPPLCKQVLEAAPQEWRDYVRQLAAAQPEALVYDIFWNTYKEIVRRGAQKIIEVFEASKYKRGFISGQVDPCKLHDTAAMVAQGCELRQASPNIMIKLPGTKEGIEGIRQLTALGIATNATLTFTVSQLVAVAEAVRAGLEEARRNGVDLSQWRSCGTHMLGRFEDAGEFRRQAEARSIALSETDLRWAGIAVFNKILRLFKARGYLTKPLAASMRIGPTLDGRKHIWHIERLCHKPVVLTIFPNIIEAFLEAGDAAMPDDVGDSDAPKEVLDKLLRIPYFVQAYEEEGITSEEFATYPATIETATQFAQATREMIAWVEGSLEN
jgi:transaldolase